MRSVALMAVGDLVLDEPDPASFFVPSRPTLARGDVVIGHVEVPHTTSTAQQSTDVPAHPADPGALNVLPEAGFDVVTLAGNHVYDCGDIGVSHTLEYAQRAGLATAGAGRTLDEARRPAIVERGGLRIGVLSYNCVGPRESWATSAKPGCAYVWVLTHYELDHASPGGPPRIYTFADPDSLDAMAADVAALRDRVDAIVVSLHKGVGHTPTTVAMYERPVARAAVDAGADAVFAHHAHIMRGVEAYRGRPIYHGLGNFVTVTHALTPTDNDSAERREWTRRRTEIYGFTPDPDMPYYPFHPDSRHTAVAVCRFDDTGLVAAGLAPCWIDDLGRPTPLGRETGGEAVAEYIRRITAEARLGADLAWHGDELIIAGCGRATNGALMGGTHGQ